MPGTAAPTHSERVSGLARVAATGIVWGTIPLVLRAADGAPTVKVFFRVALAALVVGGWMLASGGWRELVTLSRDKLRQAATQGLLLTLNWFLFLSALDLTTVATAELLAYTGPVFVALLTPAVTGDPFDRRVLVPLALALGGIALILAQHGFDLGGARSALGAGLAAASALTYAALLLRSKRILRGISSGALMLIEYTVASVVLAPFVAHANATGGGPTSLRSYLALAALGVVHTALAGFVFLSGLRRVRADHAAILMYAEPVSAVVFAALLLAEPLTLATALGGAAVVLGGVLAARMEPMPGFEAPGATVEVGATGCGGRGHERS
jgi:drug/metabolite transporter (DMT)-like permease